MNLVFINAQYLKNGTIINLGNIEKYSCKALTFV